MTATTVVMSVLKVALVDSEQQETEARKNDVFPFTARRSWVAFSEDPLSRYLHAWGSGAENQPPRVTSAGICVLLS